MLDATIVAISVPRLFALETAPATDVVLVMG
jgi:hypothetical protein